MQSVEWTLVAWHHSRMMPKIVSRFAGQVQKKILGDIREQKISQVYDEDAREEKVYRRPPTFLVIASKIVRPSTVYQVKWSNAGMAEPLS